MTKTERADKIIEILKNMFPKRIQMFDCIGSEPDEKTELFRDEDVVVLYAMAWEYVEVLGLPDNEYRRVFDAIGY